MNLQPYLCLGGTEVANAQRTLSYLLRGLGDSRVEVPRRAGVGVGSGGYVDLYSDLYEAGGSFPEQLVCYCAALDDGSNYLSPADDPAPWYESAVPASVRFLGVSLDTLTMTSSPVRGVYPRVAGGANVGRVHRRHKVLSASGLMHATDSAGMAWGERWLTEVLSGGMCETCGGDEAEILPFCPTAEDTADPFRLLHQVGLVDGPTFTPIQDIPGCVLQEVSFQLVAGDPYLYHPTSHTLTNSPLNSTGISSRSSIKETNEWGGEMAVRIDIEATSDLQSVLITATPIAEDGVCPDSGSNPCAVYELGSLPVGHTFTIDAIERDVTETNNTSKQATSGFGALNFDGEFAWIVVPPCSRMCITVDIVGSGTALVSFSNAIREL